MVSAVVVGGSCVHHLDLGMTGGLPGWARSCRRRCRRRRSLSRPCATLLVPAPPQLLPRRPPPRGVCRCPGAQAAGAPTPNWCPPPHLFVLPPRSVGDDAVRQDARGNGPVGFDAILVCNARRAAPRRARAAGSTGSGRRPVWCRCHRYRRHRPSPRHGLHSRDRRDVDGLPPPAADGPDEQSARERGKPESRAARVQRRAAHAAAHRPSLPRLPVARAPLGASSRCARRRRAQPPDAGAQAEHATL